VGVVEFAERDDGNCGDGQSVVVVGLGVSTSFRKPCLLVLFLRIPKTTQ
jgi:hypothetical protein